MANALVAIIGEWRCYYDQAKKKHGITILFLSPAFPSLGVAPPGTNSSSSKWSVKIKNDILCLVLVFTTETGGTPVCPHFSPLFQIIGAYA